MKTRIKGTKNLSHNSVITRLLLELCQGRCSDVTLKLRYTGSYNTESHI